jgi:hypothetical protein
MWFEKAFSWTGERFLCTYPGNASIQANRKTPLAAYECKLVQYKNCGYRLLPRILFFCAVGIMHAADLMVKLNQKDRGP